MQLISDEIYHGIEYASPAQHSSAWETSREAVVFNSFSKYFSMTGWRIGWMLVPERLRRAVDVLTGNFTICPPVLAQHAAVAAFTDASYAEVDAHVARYAQNRALLLDGLPRLGLDGSPADGAFYVYADVSHLVDGTMAAGSMALCHRLLAETGVATAPGVDFDTVAGDRFVRLSFAGSPAEVGQALHRLEGWLAAGEPRPSAVGVDPLLRRAPYDGQLAVEVRAGAGRLVGVAVAVDDREPHPGARGVPVAPREHPDPADRVAPVQVQLPGGEPGEGPGQLRARDRFLVVADGGDADGVAVEPQGVQAPRTGCITPPARPAQILPNLSTRKL